MREVTDFGGERVLVVERFDRRWTSDRRRLLRLPQEDCCQALSVSPTLKYEPDGGPGIRDVLALLKAGDEPAFDQRTFLKAQIVYWLLGATDGHAKNFSIFLKPGGRFNLTPLYDVMSLQPAIDASRLRKNQFRFANAVGNNRHYIIDGILPRHFVQTAENSGLPGAVVDGIYAELAETAETAIDATVAALPEGFPEALAESIVGGFRTRLRLIRDSSARFTVNSHWCGGHVAPACRVWDEMASCPPELSATGSGQRGGGPGAISAASSRSAMYCNSSTKAPRPCPDRARPLRRIQRVRSGQRPGRRCRRGHVLEPGPD